jgi:hypothetical protein
VPKAERSLPIEFRILVLSLDFDVSTLSSSAGYFVYVPSASTLSGMFTVGELPGVIDGLTTKRLALLIYPILAGEPLSPAKPLNEREAGATKGDRDSGVLASSSRGSTRAQEKNVMIAGDCQFAT